MFVFVLLLSAFHLVVHNARGTLVHPCRTEAKASNLEQSATPQYLVFTDGLIHWLLFVSFPLSKVAGPRFD